MDREVAARAIANEAKRVRKRDPRWLWIAALVVAAVCAGGLAIAWFADRDTEPERHLQGPPSEHGASFGLGIMVGLGLGIAIGSVIAVRSRR